MFSASSLAFVLKFLTLWFNLPAWCWKFGSSFVKHSIMPNPITTITAEAQIDYDSFSSLLLSALSFLLPALFRSSTTSKWNFQFVEPLEHQCFIESTMFSSLPFSWKKLVYMHFYVPNSSCDSILRYSFSRNTMPTAKAKNQWLLGIFPRISIEGRHLLEAFKKVKRNPLQCSSNLHFP